MSTDSEAPLVSVITATYNSSATLKLAIASVLKQDYPNLEHWVIGDGCTDDSEEMVAALDDPRVHWHNLARNSGSQSAPNNEGLRRARGRYIAYFGHDDLWLPWHLSALVQHLEHSGADLVHSLCPLIGPEGVIDIIGPPRDGVGYDLHFIPPTSWLHRRELVEAIGRWQDPDAITRAVDWDFTRRTYLAGKRIECVPSLSVLKFPSLFWRAYARKGEPPQVAYWQAMQQDPHEAARQVLNGFAITYARLYRQGQVVPPLLAWRDLRAGWRRFVLSGRSALLNRYGRERWPLSAILPRQYRQAREEIRRRRGLAR